MTPAELETAGRLLYGPRWQSALARRLRVDPRTVRRWLSGERAMEGPAQTAIELLLRHPDEA